MMYFWNYDAADKKLRDLYRTPEFKQAMSFALDRPTIQKTVYFGTGILTTGTMSPKAFEFNFNAEAQAYCKKARDIYSAYDPEKAKTLLDGIGCKVGADGKRTYPDGTPLEVRIDIPADANKEATDVLQIAQKNWEDVGLNIVINQVTPTAFDRSVGSGQANHPHCLGSGRWPRPPALPELGRPQRADPLGAAVRQPAAVCRHTFGELRGGCQPVGSHTTAL